MRSGGPGGPPRWAERRLERLLGGSPWGDGVLGDLAEEWHRRRRGSPTWLCHLRYVAQGTSVVAWRLAGRNPGAGLARDARHTVRTLLRQPGFTGVVVATLALAIGANAAVFGIADRLLLRGPEHVRDPGGVLRLYGHMSAGPRGTRVTDRWGYVTYADLAAGADDLAAVAAYATVTGTMGRGRDARRVRIGYATDDLFPLLGVRPRAGRFFAPGETGPAGAGDVAVLDAGFWQRAYGGDPGVLGRAIEVGGETFTVVGVTPEGFTGADLEPIDVWLPEVVQGRQIREDWATVRHSSWLRVVTRLRPGVDPAGASERLTALHRAAAVAEAPDELRSRARLELLPLGRGDGGVTPPEVAVARWLLAVAAAVLLIAIANVSSLQLARGARRRREVAVRLSLGISRGRLVGLFLSESFLLAGAGTLLGLLLAHLGAGVVRAVLLPDVAWTSPPVNGRVLAFSAAVATAVAVTVGLVPALAALRARPGALHAAARGGRDGGGRTRQALLVLQPCLALVLLVGAGLFVSSLVRVRAVRLGFDAERVLAVSPSWRATGEADGEDGQETGGANPAALRARDHFARLPWVESASLTVGLPFYTSFGVRIRADGADSLPPLTGEGPSIMGVTPEYFTTVGTARVRGRLFGRGDVAGAEPVAVVNRAMAAAFWPDGDALGRCLTLYDARVPCVRVVGVVEDIRQWSVTGEPALMFYVPVLQAREISGPLLLVRPVGDPSDAVERVRRELLGLWPDLPWFDVFTLQRRIDPQIRPWRMGATLFSLFGVLALLVAGAGLFSVLAYLVEQRRRELGVRSALGASARAILVETVVRGLVPAVVGLALGVLVALPLGAWLEPLLYGTSGHDPVVFLGATGLLLVVAVAGTLVPARRAARADPMVALRDG